MDQYSRRDAIKVASAAGLVGITGNTGKLAAAGSQDLKENASVRTHYQEYEKHHSLLAERLKSVAPARRQLTTKAIEQLATQLSTSVGSPFELEAALALFYSLGMEETETVLTLVRARMAAEPGETQEERSLKASLRNSEKAISLAVKELNKESVKKTKRPFQVATLMSAAPSLDKVISHKDVLSFQGAKSSGISCPIDTYPMNFKPVLPWNLQAANDQSHRQRVEDPGSCNINHGPFKKNIKGWVSFAPVIYLMAAANGFGSFQLVGNDKNLFVKWWTLVPFGLFPFNLLSKLLTRHM